jgi:hypothetical protein
MICYVHFFSIIALSRSMFCSIFYHILSCRSATVWMMETLENTCFIFHGLLVANGEQESGMWQWSWMGIDDLADRNMEIPWAGIDTWALNLWNQVFMWLWDVLFEALSKKSVSERCVFRELLLQQSWRLKLQEPITVLLESNLLVSTLRKRFLLIFLHHLVQVFPVFCLWMFSD